MYGSWVKRVYSTFFCIGCARANFVFEQIYSHCKWITHDTLRHMSVKHFRICTKYETKEFTQKFQVLTERDTNMWQIMIWKVTTQMEWSQPLFWAFPHQYLKFLSKLFCSILYTYAEVFYTHVSQSVMCNPLAVKEPIWCLIEQIHSHYTWHLETHECKTLQHMYKVWNKRVYSKISSIGEEKLKIVVETIPFVL